MVSFRDIKRQARRTLHQHLQVPARYLIKAPVTDPPGEPYSTNLLVTVRVHLEFEKMGDMAGTNFHYAERRQDAPEIIFMRDQVEPVRGAIISVEAGEAYRIDHTHPADDITVRATVTRLTASEAAGLPLPTDEEE